MLRSVCFAIAKPAADAIAQSGDARLLGAIRTTEDGVALLHAVADHLATAMGTGRREGMDGAFEGIEDVLVPFHDHGKGAIVIITANFALGHDSTSILRIRRK
jgi:hypothetical protein